MDESRAILLHKVLALLDAVETEAGHSLVMDSNTQAHEANRLKQS